MELALVPTTSKPCTTSELVMRNVTALPAGTSMGSGANEKSEATTLTMTLPSACAFTPGLPNSGLEASVVGSMVSTCVGGCSACAPVVKPIAPRNSSSSAADIHIQI